MYPIQFKQAAAGNYRKGRQGTIKYIVMHYTANNGDTAKNNADYFARAVTQTSAHYFVDRNSIWQSVKDTDTAYHCGTSKGYKHPECRNANSIGIEMCDSLNGVPDGVRATALDLAAYLMKKYNIPISNVVRHYDVTGKLCPRPWVNDPNKWNEFINLLSARINETDEEDDENMTDEKFAEMMDRYIANRRAKPVSSWAKNDFAKAKTDGLMDGTAPQDWVTREQLATVAIRLENKK